MPCLRLHWLSSPCLALLAACGTEPVELPPGLLLQADFEGSCEPASVAELGLDLSGSGRSFDEGVEGKAVRFDGSGCAVTYEGVGRLPLTDALTLEFFFSADGWRNPYDSSAVLESLASHSDVFTIALQPDAWVLSARLQVGADETSIALVGGLVTPSTWHHVALVLDPLAQEGRLALDGEVVASAPMSGRLRLLEDVPLTLGTWFGKNQAFAGRLDSLRLWNRALSSEELAARAALVARPGS